MVMAGMVVTGERRRREVQRAMRAHPAGRALAGCAPGAVPGARVPPLEWQGRPAAPLRLTRRGRRLLTLLALVAVVGVALLVGALAGGPGAGRSLELVGESRVVVRPGDTLWSIASSVAGDDDVRLVVHRIQEVNRLQGTRLVPGEVLRLP